MAAYEIYLKLEGISGEAVGDHANEIILNHVDWGVDNHSNAINQGSSGGQGVVRNISVNKQVDKASPNLMKYSLNGQHIPTATITIRKSAGDRIDYVTMEFKKVFITSVSAGANPESVTLGETVQLSYQEMKFTYTPQKPDGTAGAKVPVTLNAVTSKAT